MPSIFARELRRNSTEVERKLWRQLRNSQLDGYKFRRQHPIGPYTVDFFCEQAGLIFELDGSQHVENAEADARRTGFLNKGSYRVIRFWNIDIVQSMDGLIDTILYELKKNPSPAPSR